MNPVDRQGAAFRSAEHRLFEDDRQGSIRDIFWVPMSEVPEKLQNKQPLFASELDLTTPALPQVQVDDRKRRVKDEAVGAMKKLADDVGRSKRAQADLANRTHAIAVKTGGGDFALYVSDSLMSVDDGLPDAPEFTMVADDPAIFTDWVGDGSLTDAAVEGTLWLPHKQAFQVLPILDRLPRSTRRDLRDEQS